MSKGIEAAQRCERRSGAAVAVLSAGRGARCGLC